MLKVGSWLVQRGKGNTSTASLNALDEPRDIEEALRAVTHIMNDDLEAAEGGLAQGNSAFHKLGRGVVSFLKAVLGLEQDVMREASERLNDAETAAYNDQRRAQKEVKAYRSSIYPIGSEFALVGVECQIMSAVMGVLNESLTESVKGFYKIRKAFVTLDSILEAENRYMKGARSSTSLANSSKTSLVSEKASLSHMTNGQRPTSSQLSSPSAIKTSTPGPHNGQEHDDDDEFYDADETPTHDDNVPNKAPTFTPGGVNEPPSSPLGVSNDSTINHDPDSETFANPIDMYIHSGSSLCFGLLLLLISMVPSVFAKLLSIIGFRGDRERGLHLLWQASKFDNINGGVAGLVLLGFYNGVQGFCDIIPDQEENTIEGPSPERCEKLLASMRERYPKSHLWKLEEARMKASRRQLGDALQILNEPSKSPLKQVEALKMFEKSLDSMFSHQYELTAESFLACMKLNNWSHGLYYYIAGAAHVELYRKGKIQNIEKAKAHAEKAKALFKEVPANAGKKKFLARQLPFDDFVLRKVQKWQHRAHEWDVDLIDAVGVSPIEEMIFFWYGYKRMSEADIQASLDALEWSRNTTLNPTWDREGLDEHAIYAFLKAVTLSHHSAVAQARSILQDEILSHDRHLFKGYLKDDWTCPAAHYEMAALSWMERKQSGDELAKVKECSEWLDKVARWEHYDLDTRVGIKITTAQDTIRRYHQRRAV